MNKIATVSVKALLALIVLVGGAKLAFDLLKKLQKDGKPSDEFPPNGDLSHQATSHKPKPHLENKKLSNDQFHIDIAKSLMDKYNLRTESDNSFFQIFPLLQLEGKRFFLSSMYNLIEERVPAEQIVEAYSNLSKTFLKLDILPNEETKASPVISKSIMDVYFIEYGLKELAEKDIRMALFELFDYEYNKGIKREVAFFEVNIKWLRNYIDKMDVAKIEKEVSSITQKINEEKVLLKIT